jgi:hypothetical protein
VILPTLSVFIGTWARAQSHAQRDSSGPEANEDRRRDLLAALLFFLRDDASVVVGAAFATTAVHGNEDFGRTGIRNRESVGNKTLEEHFYEQAELIDRRFADSFREEGELIDRRFADGFCEQAELIDWLFVYGFEEFGKKRAAAIDSKLADLEGSSKPSSI